MLTRAIQIQDASNLDASYTVQLGSITAVKENKKDGTVWIIGPGIEILVKMTVAEVLTMLDWQLSGSHTGHIGRGSR
jgi:hypothetical protein